MPYNQTLMALGNTQNLLTNIGNQRIASEANKIKNRLSIAELGLKRDEMQSSLASARVKSLLDLQKEQNDQTNAMADLKIKQGILDIQRQKAEEDKEQNRMGTMLGFAKELLMKDGMDDATAEKIAREKIYPNWDESSLTMPIAKKDVFDYLKSKEQSENAIRLKNMELSDKNTSDAFSKLKFDADQLEGVPASDYAVKAYKKAAAEQGYKVVTGIRKKKVKVGQTFDPETMAYVDKYVDTDVPVHTLYSKTAYDTAMPKYDSEVEKQLNSDHAFEPVGTTSTDPESNRIYTKTAGGWKFTKEGE